MLLKRTPGCFGSNPIQSILITRMWSHDGWCYIPELRVRERFWVHGDNYRYENEPWTGFIPFPEHSELLTYHLLSRTPLRWTEQRGIGWSETYEELREEPEMPIQTSV